MRKYSCSCSFVRACVSRPPLPCGRMCGIALFISRLLGHHPRRSIVTIPISYVILRNTCHVHNALSTTAVYSHTGRNLAILLTCVYTSTQQSVAVHEPQVYMSCTGMRVVLIRRRRAGENCGEINRRTHTHRGKEGRLKKKKGGEKNGAERRGKAKNEN